MCVGGRGAVRNSNAQEGVGVGSGTDWGEWICFLAFWGGSKSDVQLTPIKHRIHLGMIMAILVNI